MNKTLQPQVGDGRLRCPHQASRALFLSLPTCPRHCEFAPNRGQTGLSPFSPQLASKDNSILPSTSHRFSFALRPFCHFLRAPAGTFAHTSRENRETGDRRDCPHFPQLGSKDNSILPSTSHRFSFALRPFCHFLRAPAGTFVRTSRNIVRTIPLVSPKNQNGQPGFDPP
jgi:hypothetical protein